MKKLINIFCIVSLIALMTSCAKTYQAKLHATADQINKELPMDLGNGICMDSLSYDRLSMQIPLPRSMGSSLLIWSAVACSFA